MADDILAGACCAICGRYFEDPENDEAIYEHGHAVACIECYSPECGYIEATVPTI
jgi:hypothetical protein